MPITVEEVWFTVQHGVVYCTEMPAVQDRAAVHDSQAQRRAEPEGGGGGGGGEQAAPGGAPPPPDCCAIQLSC